MDATLFTDDEIKAASPEARQVLEVGNKLHKALSTRADKREIDLAEKLVKQFEAALQKMAEDLAKKNPTWSLPGVETDPTKGPKKSFSLARAACAVATRNWGLAGYEKEVFDAMQAKAMNFGQDTAGGFMVPQEVLGGLIEKLLPQVIAFQLGVRQIDAGNVSPIIRNRKTSTMTAEWVGEMVTAAKSQVKLERMQLTPKALSAKADISNLLNLLTGGAAETLLIDDMAPLFARGIDKAVFLGALPRGPVGVANTPGIGTSTSASLDYDKMVDFEIALMNAEAMGLPNIGWAMTVSQYALIRKLKDTSGQPLEFRSIQTGGPGTILGYPYRTSTQLGTTGINTLMLAAWSTVALYRWFGGMLLKASDTSDTALDSDVLRVVGRFYADVGVEQPSACIVASA